MFCLSVTHFVRNINYSLTFVVNNLYLILMNRSKLELIYIQVVINVVTHFIRNNRNSLRSFLESIVTLILFLSITRTRNYTTNLKPCQLEVSLVCCILATYFQTILYFFDLDQLFNNPILCDKES